MAKRANPYSEDFVQQSKIHVSLKQFNNNEDRLKKVYEKTLLKLFQGAKKSQNQDATHDSNVIFRDKKDKLKQLFIGKNGTLSHLGTMVNEYNFYIYFCYLFIYGSSNLLRWMTLRCVSPAVVAVWLHSAASTVSELCAASVSIYVHCVIIHIVVNAPLLGRKGRKSVCPVIVELLGIKLFLYIFKCYLLVT